MRNILINHFQLTHKDGYLIDTLKPWQLDALEKLLQYRRGDISADAVIEAALILVDVN